MPSETVNFNSVHLIGRFGEAERTFFLTSYTFFFWVLNAFWLEIEMWLHAQELELKNIFLILLLNAVHCTKLFYFYWCSVFVQCLLQWSTVLDSDDNNNSELLIITGTANSFSLQFSYRHSVQLGRSISLSMRNFSFSCKTLFFNLSEFKRKLKLKKKSNLFVQKEVHKLQLRITNSPWEWSLVIKEEDWKLG